MGNNTADSVSSSGQILTTKPFSNGGFSMTPQNQAAYQSATAGKTGAAYTTATNNFFSANPGSATMSNVYGSPIYTPPSGGATGSSPVITSAGASSDLASKQDSFNNLQSTNVAQGQAVQANKLSAAQQKTIDDNNALQNKIQQQNANNDTTTANAKAAAITGVPTAPTSGTPAVGNTSSNDTTSSNPIQDSLNSNTSTYLGKQQDIQGQRDTLSNQFNPALSSVLSGTFPLSAPQQALITSLQNQLATNTTLQQNSNDSQVGTARESAFRSGGEYSPTEMANTIGNVISTGVQRIQELDNSAASTIANLEQSFQKQDFDEINTQYQTLSKQLDDKSSSIKDMYDTVTSALKDQRDSEAAAAKNAFDENLQTSTFNENVLKDQNDNLYKNAQLTEQQWKDNQDVINQRESLRADSQYKAAEIAKIYSDMGTADVTAASNWAAAIKAGTAKLSDVPKGLKNAVIANTVNGGSSATSDLLNTTKTSIDELNAMVNSNHGFTAAVGAKGIIQDPLALFGQGPLAGTPAADFNAKLKQTLNDVVLPNLTILHGLGRVTDREFQALQSSITSLSTNQSEGQFKSELKDITDRVNAKIAEQQNDPSTIVDTLINGTSTSGLDSLAQTYTH